MKSSIKTCLVESKRITGSAKLTICTAVILSLAFTANVSAGPTVTLPTLTADTLTPGNYLGTSPLLVIATSYGNITFVGEIRDVSTIFPPDAEFIAAHASGNAFDILDAGIPGSQTAELFFDFDVESIEFIYGGNTGSILIEAQDVLGNPLPSPSASFFQPSTLAYPAGPEIVSGSGIRSLYWTDTFSATGFAALDNIKVTVGVIPSPSAAILTGIGVSFVGWLRRRKVV